MLIEELLCFQQTDFSTLRETDACASFFFFLAKCREHISPDFREIIPVNNKLAQFSKLPFTMY